MARQPTVYWSTFKGYMSLENTPEGQRAVNVQAFDAASKIGQGSRNFVKAGVNFLISNRGFEAGSTNWNIAGGAWIPNSADSAFLGSRYVSMAPNSSIPQQFSVPAAAQSCTVGYRVSVTSHPVTSPALVAELLQANGTTVDTLLNSISTSEDTFDLNSNHYKRFTHTVSDCGGKTLWLRFRTSLTSPADQYRIDNVFVTYDAPVTANFSATADEAEKTVIMEVKNIQNIALNSISYVEIGSPGIAGNKWYNAPYLSIRPTSDFVLNADYQAQASIANAGGTKVYTSPVVPFIVREVNQLINNPGFEPNGVWWNNTGATSFCGAPGPGEGSLGFVGNGCAIFSGPGTLYQTVNIPAGPGEAALTFRLRIAAGTSAHSLLVKAENTATGVSTVLNPEIKGDTNTLAGIRHRGYRKFRIQPDPIYGTANPHHVPCNWKLARSHAP